MPTPTPQAELQRISAALQLAERDDDVPAQIRLYRQLLKITPDLAIAHAALAKVLLQSGDEAAAIPHVEFALAQPQDEKIDKCLFGALSTCKHFTGQLERAKEWFEATPNLYRFLLLYEALQETGAKTEIERLLQWMLSQERPAIQQSKLLTLLGQQYYADGRFHDCIGCYQLSLQLAPGSIPEMNNLALAMEQVGNYKDAMDIYQQVLKLDPAHAGAHNNIGLLLLRHGHFEKGWEEFEWRWQATQGEHFQHFNIPRWQGEPLEGKSLIVWAEQGIGDHIMFASMLNELSQLCTNLHYEIYARLDPLFRRSFPGVRFIRREQHGEEQLGDQPVFKQTWPQADYQIAVGSLPSLLRRSREAFPIQRQYLWADTEATTRLRAEYHSRFPGKRLIGVSWRGGRDIGNESQSRRIPLTQLGRLSKLPNVQLINLQYGDVVDEMEEATRNGVDIFNDTRVNPLANMDNQATQISALDAVVSIDNTTVHLAGALGVPTYALLPLNPNFRWGLEEGPSYWYPSVHLIRNREIGRWETALDRAVAAMRDNGHL